MTKALELSVHQSIVQYDNTNIQHHDIRLLACANAVLLHKAPLKALQISMHHVPCFRVSVLVSVITPGIWLINKLHFVYSLTTMVDMTTIAQ